MFGFFIEKVFFSAKNERERECRQNYLRWSKLSRVLLVLMLRDYNGSGAKQSEKFSNSLFAYDKRKNRTRQKSTFS